MVMFVPHLLARLLVVISFNWDLSKLVYLRTLLREVIGYRQFTDVDIIVVTNNNDSLIYALQAYQLDNVTVHLFTSQSKQYTGNKYDMLWEHRTIFEDKYRNDNHTTFLYMEDDTLFPWAHLVSWAIDSEILEPLNFTRGIFRTEINDAGKSSMNDMVVDLANFLWCHMNLTKDLNNPHYVPSIDLATYSDVSSGLYQRTLKRYEQQLCYRAGELPRLLPHHAHDTPRRHYKVFQPCPVHRQFVQLYNPLQGLSILSRSHLGKLMAHPLWDKAASLRVETRRAGQKNWNWGYPERSNSILLYAHPPSGFLTTNVVPYHLVKDSVTDTVRPRLLLYGRVEHMRNGYNVVCTADEALTF